MTEPVSESLSAVAWQKREDNIGVFWDRRLSRSVTPVLLQLGVTPNQATLLWGAVSLANSYTVYRALTGDYLLIPVVFVVYFLASVIDCSDGEIARATNRVNPVAGKLLDGICHRATEYSLIGVFGAGAWTLTNSVWALPATALLMSGDAMYSYVNERRLLILRVEHQQKGHVQRSPRGLYTWGTPWMALSSQQKLATLTGLLHYKSVYPVIALAYVSGSVLLVGLAGLAAFKHWKWIKLMAVTVAATERHLASQAATAAPEFAGAAVGEHAHGSEH